MLMTYICGPGQELLLVLQMYVAEILIATYGLHLLYFVQTWFVTASFCRLFTRDEFINWNCFVIQTIQINHLLYNFRVESIWHVWIKKLDWYWCIHFHLCQLLRLFMNDGGPYNWLSTFLGWARPISYAWELAKGVYNGRHPDRLKKGDVNSEESQAASASWRYFHFHWFSKCYTWIKIKP
jgi:hypothetical protein